MLRSLKCNLNSLHIYVGAFYLYRLAKPPFWLEHGYIITSKKNGGMWLLILAINTVLSKQLCSHVVYAYELANVWKSHHALQLQNNNSRCYPQWTNIKLWTPDFQIFKSKGDKLCSSAEFRIWTRVFGTESPADWMPADKPTELSRIKLKTSHSSYNNIIGDIINTFTVF